MSKKKKKSGLWGGMMMLINIIVIFLLLISYLPTIISPISIPYLSVFGYAYPLFLLINLLFVVFWLFSSKKIRSLFSVAAVLIGWNVFFSHFQFFNNYSKIKTNSEISIMTFNTGHNSYKNGTKVALQERDSLVKLIKNAHFDIICLQEFSGTRKMLKNITNEMSNGSESYNVTTASSSPKSLNKGATFAFITDFPIVSSSELTYNDMTFGIINDVAVREDTLKVFNVHLYSNMLSDEDINDVNNIHQQAKDKKVLDLSKNLVHKFDKGAKIRAKQARIIDSIVKSSKYRVIVCGDMNDTPCTYTYTKIRGDLKDAFVEKGWGWGNTYTGKLPNIRIDYILCDNLFRINAYKTLKNINISDHYPVTAFIDLKNEL